MGLSERVIRYDQAIASTRLHRFTKVAESLSEDSMWDISSLQ